MGGYTSNFAEGYAGIQSDGDFFVFPTPVEANRLSVFSAIQNLTPQSYQVKPSFDYYGGLTNFSAHAAFTHLPLPSAVTTQMAAVTEEMVAALSAELPETESDAWITIRFQAKSPMFDAPRWHIDGLMYPDATRVQYKIGGALFGPSTLFYNIPPAQREYFAQQTTAVAEQFGVQLSSNPQAAMDEWIKARKALDAEVLRENVLQAPAHHMAIFSVGKTQTAAFHSEPSMSSENRMFFSMVPGTKKHIDTLKLQFETGSAKMLQPS